MHSSTSGSNTSYSSPRWSTGLPYGWAGELSIPNTIGFVKHRILYIEIVEWIQENIKNCDNNAEWAKIGDCLYFRIRKPKDWTWFNLVWGHCK